VQILTDLCRRCSKGTSRFRYFAEVHFHWSTITLHEEKKLWQKYFSFDLSLHLCHYHNHCWNEKGICNFLWSNHLPLSEVKY